MDVPCQLLAVAKSRAFGALPRRAHVRTIGLSLLAVAAPALARDAAAQNTSAAASAETVVRTAFAELDSMRWAGAAALVHPETLARFRAWSLENVRMAERYQLEPYPRDPTMPAEVAAWFEEQRRKDEERRKQLGPMLSQEFAGIQTLAQLEALSAEEMFTRHLQASDPREVLKLEMALQGRQIPFPALGELDAMFRPQRTVIGPTVEDDSTVHVVYRTGFSGPPERDPRHTRRRDDATDGGRMAHLDGITRPTALR